MARHPVSRYTDHLKAEKKSRVPGLLEGPIQSVEERIFALMDRVVALKDAGGNSNLDRTSLLTVFGLTLTSLVEIKCKVDRTQAENSILFLLDGIEALAHKEASDSRKMTLAGMKLRLARLKSEIIRNKTATIEHASWQGRAQAYWANNPRLSKSAVAQMIDPLRAGYIRKFIKKVGH